MSDHDVHETTVIPQPTMGQAEWVLQSAVDLETGDPVVVVRWGRLEATISPDMARGIAVQCATAAGRAEAAFVRLLRDSGFDDQEMTRRQLSELYARY